MNVIVRLLTFYEYAKYRLDRPVAEIFPFIGGRTGLQMLAEFIARIAAENLSVMLFPSNGIENLMLTPSGRFRGMFQLDGKINDLFEDHHFILVIQKEKHISSGNYVVLKIMYDGDTIEVYHVTALAPKAFFITEFDVNNFASHKHLLKQSIRMILSEVDSVMDP